MKDIKDIFVICLICILSFSVGINFHKNTYKNDGYTANIQNTSPVQMPKENYLENTEKKILFSLPSVYGFSFLGESPAEFREVMKTLRGSVVSSPIVSDTEVFIGAQKAQGNIEYIDYFN